MALLGFTTLQTPPRNSYLQERKATLWVITFSLKKMGDIKGETAATDGENRKARGIRLVGVSTDC